MTKPECTIHPGQFRLSRIQLVNWGTFDNYVDMPVARKGFLITGGSGSGKSTLIDAMSSVLVPPDRVRFNAAAQQQVKRGQGRSLVSYVRGAWRRRESATTGEITATYLREKATYTVVGLTYDDGAGLQLTLAAFSYLKAGANSPTEVEKAFLIFPTDQDLGEMHRYLSRGIDKRKLKADFPDARHHATHSAFSAAFRRQLGISNPEAMLLLHRTQSAKSLSSLDTLFRDYMLPEPRTFRIATEAVEQFGELRTAYHKVQDVKAQIEVLEPLQKLSTSRDSAAQSLAEAQEMKQVLPTVRDQVHATQLQDEIRAAEARFGSAAAAFEQAAEQVAHARDNQARAQAAVTGHGERGVLDVQLAAAKQQLGTRERTRDAVADAITRLGGDMAQTPEDFEAIRGQALAITEEHEQTMAGLAEQRDDAVGARRTAESELGTVQAELTSLAQHSSNIDRRYIQIRRELCQELGVAERELVFAGELIDIAPDSRDWEPVIQRELGGLAVTLLVPESLRPQVSTWVNGRHLGIRLEYRAIPDRVEPVRGPADPRALSRKLQIIDHRMHAWLIGEIRSRYEYICVDTVEELDVVHERQRAVTRQGLVRGWREKDGSTRFVKNDRHRLGDPSRYRLGSSNDEKVELLGEQKLQLERQVAATSRQIRELERRQDNRRVLLGAAELVLRHGWQEIDTTADLARITDLEQQIEQWAASPETAKLQAELERVNTELDEANAAHTAAIEQRTRITTQLSTLTEELTEVTARTSEVSVPEQLRTKAESLLGRHTRRVTARSIQKAHEESLNELDQQIAEAQRTITRTNATIGRVLHEYLSRWPGQQAELQADPSFAGEAIARLTSLRTDGLAALTDRFLHLMNGTSVQNLSTLASELRRAQGDVETEMEPVNQSLSRSQFNDGRWLYIDVRDNRGPVAMEFQRDLTAAISGGLSTSSAAEAEQAEARYRRMSVILDRLGSSDSEDVRWRRTVLDTRRHVSFVGVEIDEAGETVNTYVDSASLSGGQAQKLVFFCLAAALRYQLAEPDEEFPRYATVVLDEAFDRADPTFTRTAMNVFTTFGFHMVLATPMKLIQTLSPYVDGTILVNYRERPDARGQIRAASNYAFIDTTAETGAPAQPEEPEA